MAKLVAETGEFQGAEYPLGGKPLVLGRLKSNDIEVRDTKASRKHTRVGRAGGRWVVEDLKSSNGTFVNGEQIESRVELHPGDRISIGKTVFRFELEEDAAAPAPARAPAKPRPAPAPAPVVPDDPVDDDGPEELSLEEPEELGLDASAPAAPAAPAAPRAPAAPAPRPAVRGEAVVSINSVQRPSRIGFLGQDLGQRDWRYQAIIYLVGVALFVGLVYGAYALAMGALGPPPDEIPVGETADPDAAGD